MIDQALVATHLREVAAYLWLAGEPFRARAYQRAAQTVATLPDLERVLQAGGLTLLPRIGTSLASAIEELAARGTLPLLERLPMLLPEARELLAQLVQHLAGSLAARAVEPAGQVRRRRSGGACAAASRSRAASREPLPGAPA